MLITLGIIGVVAAMTIPTLVQNYKKKVTESKLVKVVSLMNQAIKMSTIENGDVTTWRNLGASSTSTATYQDTLDWFNTYLGPYLKTQKIEKSTQDGGDVLAVYLMDGSALTFALYIYDIHYFTDAKIVGTDTGQMGKNQFLFRFLPKRLEGQNISEFDNSINPGFAPYTFGWDGTYEGAKHASNGSGCYDTPKEGSYAGALCTKLIEMNGWKIPDDYQIKF